MQVLYPLKSLALWGQLSSLPTRLVSSRSLIKIEEVNGVKTYDFSQAQYFWLAAGVVSLVLALTVWNAKKVTDID